MKLINQLESSMQNSIDQVAYDLETVAKNLKQKMD